MANTQVTVCVRVLTMPFMMKSKATAWKMLPSKWLGRNKKIDKSLDIKPQRGDISVASNSTEQQSPSGATPTVEPVVSPRWGFVYSVQDEELLQMCRPAGATDHNNQLTHSPKHSLADGLLQIGQQVLNVLNAHAEADE